MNVFYNQEGIGDTLLVSLREIDSMKRDVQRKGDVVRLFNMDNGETSGFHIFNAKNYGEVKSSGMLAVTDEILQVINTALEKNEWDVRLDEPEEPSFVVGAVESTEKHPDADKLRVCKVDIGEETLQIVCGAKNVQQGQKVVVALTGADMPSGLHIRSSKLRGVESNGMICSISELAIPEKQQMPGIFVLDERYEVGKDFLTQYHQSQ